MTVAGSDPIGGAGVQADIKAISSMDLHGCSVITAATSQNTRAVSAIHPFSQKEVASQLDCVLEDAKISAVKTGMLYSREIAETVCSRLCRVDVPIVVDPVLVAGVGDSLYSKELLAAFREVVFPIATVITPNRGEAELLLGRRISKPKDLTRACKDLAAMGPKAVVLKGGHFDGDMATDLLYHDGKFTEFSMPDWTVGCMGAVALSRPSWPAGWPMVGGLSVPCWRRNAGCTIPSPFPIQSGMGFRWPIRPLPDRRRRCGQTYCVAWTGQCGTLRPGSYLQGGWEVPPFAMPCPTPRDMTRWAWPLSICIEGACVRPRRPSERGGPRPMPC